MKGSAACPEIVAKLRKDFGTLWACRERRDSIEITTPFSTAGQKLVSIFISARDGTYIVSDGGWLGGASDFYGRGMDPSEEAYSGCVKHFAEVFHVRTGSNASNETVYYKTTNEINLLSGAVHDVANFVVAVANAAALDSDEVTASRTRFRTEASAFVTEEFGADNVQLNERVPGLADVKFNAIVYPKPNAICLISYVTGSTPFYFSREFSNAIVGFELANTKSSAKDLIRSRIALLDDGAGGYSHERNIQLLELLGRHHGKAVVWSSRNTLVESIKAVSQN